MEYRKPLLWISILSLLIFFSFASSSSAIGIGPSRIVLDFKPGLSGTYEFLIVNNEAKDLNLDIYTRGDLAEYVTLSHSSMFVPSGTTATFTGEINLPSSLILEEPGTYDTRIGIVESSPEAGGATVVARAGVESQLWIRVPYPGKYLKVTLSAPDTIVNQQIDFAIKAENLGSEDVHASGIVEVYASGGSLITTIAIAGMDVNASSTQTLHARLDNGLAEPGSYRATAKVRYDGETANSTDTFLIGTLEIKILNLSGGERIRQGSLAPLDVEAENLWNSPVDNVYAMIKITDAGGGVVGEVQTPSTTFKQWEVKELRAYWDSNVNEGDYKATVTLHYAGKTSTKEFALHVVPGVGFEGVFIYIIVLVVIIIAAIFAFMWLRKKGKI